MSEPQALDLIDEYRAFQQRAVLFKLPPRIHLELRGDDRAAFLHNLCTNEIRKLQPGRGTEAFLTTAQGKILFHVFVFCQPQSLLIQSVCVNSMPEESQRLVAHLDRYLIREKVTLHDRSQTECGLVLAGSRAEEMLAQLSVPLPGQRLETTAGQIAHAQVQIRRMDIVPGACFLLDVARESIEQVRQKLVQVRTSLGSPALLDTLRLEAGFPIYGRDINDNNLPQEVARDNRAISFVKGCYLGQETVARIDALGHVNWLLRKIQFDGPRVPPPGAELFVPGEVKLAGRVTSAAYSPGLGRPLALAYVRRGATEPGTPLTSAFGNALVL